MKVIFLTWGIINIDNNSNVMYRCKKKHIFINTLLSGKNFQNSYY